MDAVINVVVDADDVFDVDVLMLMLMLMLERKSDSDDVMLMSVFLCR